MRARVLRCGALATRPGLLPTAFASGGDGGSGSRRPRRLRSPIRLRHALTFAATAAGGRRLLGVNGDPTLLLLLLLGLVPATLVHGGR